MGERGSLPLMVVVCVGGAIAIAVKPEFSEIADNNIE